MQQGKLVIFSAPSGSGKTTIVRHLVSVMPDKLQFSISATSRAKRGTEENGKDYYYLSHDEFRKKILNNEFLEYEEVYAGNYYGTLRSEVERIWSEGKHVIFDIDVQGGLNLKHQFKDRALAVFVMPPSIKILEERLLLRQTDSPESISLRVEKAEKELQTAKLFDCFIINEDLNKACAEAEKIVGDFLKERINVSK
jgi:guanylate kinase